MADTSKATIAAVVERLRIKASMIMLGEPIAWGSDSAVMDEAASLISALEARAEKAEAERDEFDNQLSSMTFDRDVYRANATRINARAEAAEAQVSTLQAKLEKAAEERDEWLRFIARWAWDKTGPADERLSVIQYFPPVKAARPEPLSTLRSTKS